MEYNVSRQKPVKLVKHVVLFIGQEIAEDRRFCHRIFFGPIEFITLLILRNMSVHFQAQIICFSLRI